MFTGIVEEIGIVSQVTRTSVYEVVIVAPTVASTIAASDSLCTNGACLTVTEKSGTAIHVQIIRQTRDKTNLGQLEPGDCVNLERSLTMKSRIDGHFVTGDIDGLAEITHIARQSGQWVIRLKPPQELLRYVAAQGRVTLEGISLTIAEKLGNTFSVCLIPYTLNNTTLQRKREGELLNLEVDILAKYVQEMFTGYNDTQSRITPEFLRKAGY